jgi:hypothetical protein
MVAGRCSSRSSRSRSSDVVEGDMRCDSQGPMGSGRIAAADEAGPTQTDVMSGGSDCYVLSMSLRKQAWMSMYGDVCGKLMMSEVSDGWMLIDAGGVCRDRNEKTRYK